jgi:hypothetical protein
MLNRLFAAAAGFLLLGIAAAAAAPSLQSHRAVYRMSLAKSERASDVVSADGVMVYRFVRGCDGWTTENRTVLRLDYENDVQSQTEWTFVGWEADDGRSFRFRTRFDQDGRTIEKLSGKAAVPPDGPGTATFSLPENTTIELPPHTLFPTAQLIDLLATAKAGGRHLRRLVFDGASLDNPYVVFAVMGPLPGSAAEELAKAAGLPPLPAWWTRTAFFPYAAASALPEFEFEAVYRADGIADRIVQIFEKFAIDVRLQELQLLPEPEC